MKETYISPKSEAILLYWEEGMMISTSDENVDDSDKSSQKDFQTPWNVADDEQTAE